MTDKAEQIRRIYFNDKTLSNREIANLATTSRRHVRRILNPIRNNNLIQKFIPKILILDIETMMMSCFVWYLGKQRIPYQNVIDEWNCISWAAKWLFDPKIMSDVQTPEEAINRDDCRILESLYPLLSEADIIVGQNVQKFDLRKINARLLFHGFLPPFVGQTVDTLKVLKRHFALSSYKLDDVCKFLGMPTKIHTGYELWKQCLKGEAKALKQMSDYNKNDTVITEELYLKIRGWVKSHPNCALYMESVDSSVCANCGSNNLKHNGKYYTPAGRFLAFRCLDCGAICRSRYSDLDKEEREQLLISVAR